MLALICVILIEIYETPDLTVYRKLQIKIGAIISKFAAQKVLVQLKPYFTNWSF